MRINLTVNVTKVKLHVDPIERPVEPGSVLEEGENVFEVEKILRKKTLRKGVQYLVKWKDDDATHNSWLPETELANAPDVLREFALSR